MQIEGLEDLEPIGRGGTSDVYRARDTVLGRTVAVKVFRFDGTVDDSAKAFLRECRAADALASHPNIATVHRYGISDDGAPFVVMDEAAGSLADLLRSGSLDVDRAVELTSGIVAGLREPPRPSR